MIFKTLSLNDRKISKISVEDTKFHELFDSKKNFGARALPRARAQNILPPMPKNHDF